jgi:hypothetical protein
MRISRKPIARRIAAAAIAFGLTLCICGSAAQAQDRVQAGTLACDVSPGVGLIVLSQRALNCNFSPAVPGPVEAYTGTITKVGVDLGVTTGGVLIWAVYAPTSRGYGALSGHYAGATAEATVGAGLGANVLIGGSNRTVALQPLSGQAQGGLNVAAGIAEIELNVLRPR